MILYHLIDDSGAAVAGVNESGRIESLRPPAPLPADMVRMWATRPEGVWVMGPGDDTPPGMCSITWKPYTWADSRAMYMEGLDDWLDDQGYGSQYVGPRRPRPSAR